MTMEPNDAVQALCWALVHFFEPYLWWIKSGAALALCGLMFFRMWEVPLTMRLARYVSMLGMILIALSCANTAMGPLGDLLFWPAYLAYKLMDARRLWPMVRAKMKAQPPFPEKVIFNYAMGREVVPQTLTPFAMAHPPRHNRYSER